MSNNTAELIECDSALETEINQLSAEVNEWRGSLVHLMHRCADVGDKIAAGSRGVMVATVAFDVCRAKAFSHCIVPFRISCQFADGETRPIKQASNLVTSGKSASKLNDDVAPISHDFLLVLLLAESALFLWRMINVCHLQPAFAVHRQRLRLSHIAVCVLLRDGDDGNVVFLRGIAQREADVRQFLLPVSKSLPGAQLANQVHNEEPEPCLRLRSDLRGDVLDVSPRAGVDLVSLAYVPAEAPDGVLVFPLISALLESVAIYSPPGWRSSLPL